MRRREPIARLPPSAASFTDPAPKLHEDRFIGPEVDDQVRQRTVVLRHVHTSEGVVLGEKSRHLPESWDAPAGLNEAEVLDRHLESGSRLYPREPGELPQLSKDRAKFLIAALPRANDKHPVLRCPRLLSCHTATVPNYSRKVGSPHTLGSSVPSEAVAQRPLRAGEHE